jgi:hypothetical protein
VPRLKFITTCDTICSAAPGGSGGGGGGGGGGSAEISLLSQTTPLYPQEVLYLTSTGNCNFWILLPERKTHFLGRELNCVVSYHSLVSCSCSSSVSCGCSTDRLPLSGLGVVLLELSGVWFLLLRRPLDGLDLVLG